MLFQREQVNIRRECGYNKLAGHETRDVISCAIDDSLPDVAAVTRKG